MLLLIVALYQFVGWRVSKVLLDRTALRVETRTAMLATWLAARQMRRRKSNS